MEMSIIGCGVDNLRKYLRVVSQVRSVLAKASEPVNNSNNFLCKLVSRHDNFACQGPMKASSFYFIVG